MAKSFYAEGRPQNGLAYEDYLTLMQQQVEQANTGAFDEEARRLHGYIELNFQRSSRIQRTYRVPQDLRAQIAAIATPQLWMVLTEPWCGDSAQCLPYIAKFAACNSAIDLRILPRDQNLDIMDQYLTNGSRGIPKLVAFDRAGQELFQWGPRPVEAAELFAKEKEAGLIKEEIMEKLHLWYGRNRGKAIEKEFLEIFSKLK
ncbi:MAG: thioredoxin family protein [bacterium]